MTENVKRLFAALLLLCMLLLAACGSKPAEKGGEQTPSSPEETAVGLQIETTVREIDRTGSLYLTITGKELYAAGFGFADLVTVSVAGKDFVMPIGTRDEDVSQGSMLLRVRTEAGGLNDTALIVSSGSFAADKRLATLEETEAEPGYKWTFGGAEASTVKIVLKEKDGYFNSWVKQSLKRTNKREDYPHLTDEEYANFRVIETTGMKKATLYRSSTPLAPSLGRNIQADAAARKAGVKTVINLTDTEEDMKIYGGYAETYYAGLNVIALDLEMDFTAEHFRAGTASAMRFIASSDGPYLIHCVEGKDRTGFICALIEALMGASKEEIVADYTQTYVNYYGVDKDGEIYRSIARNNIEKTLAEAFGLTTLDGADLKACADAYMKAIGLTDTEIAQVRAKLG